MPTTQTMERQELYQAVDTLPDDSVTAILNLIRSLRLDNGGYITYAPDSANANRAKKFTGTSDLKSVYVDDFKAYRREDLYDR